jgi:hypothetical protein
MPIGIVIRSAAVVLVAAAVIWSAGWIDALYAWSAWFGFAGSLLILAPSMAIELLKRQINHLSSEVPRLRDEATRDALGGEIASLERYARQFHAWHALSLCVGLALLALSFRLNL